MSRLYRMSSERVEGQLRPVVRVTCRQCGVSHAINLSKERMLPPEVIERKFAQAGWEVGSNEGRDYCPSCCAKQKQPKKESPALTIVSPAPASASPSEAAPRVMGRDDRRIIFEKLNEVYIDERRGYDTGWSDHRVAADLGVPRKWVETIRIENFGDTGASEDVVQFVADARALMEEARALLTRNDEAIQTFSAKLEKLMAAAADIKKAVGIK